MTFLLEDPSPVIYTGILIEAILGLVLFMTGRGWALFSMIGVLLLCVGLILLERWVETEVERVENTIYAVAEAAESNDINALLKFISTSAPGLRGEVQSILPGYKLTKVSIGSNLRVTIDLSDPSDPKTALAKFNVMIVGGGKSGGITDYQYPTSMDVKLRLEDGQWRIIEYKDHGRPSQFKDLHL